MTSARVKHLLWTEVWVALELAGAALLIAYVILGDVGEWLLAPSVFVALAFWAGGAGFIYHGDTFAFRSLVVFPLWMLIGWCLGLALCAGTCTIAYPQVATLATVLGWGGVTVGFLAIGMVLILMEPPITEYEGHCEHCGYDVRYGRSSRCPECGEIISHASGLAMEPRDRGRLDRPRMWRTE